MILCLRRNKNILVADSFNDKHINNSNEKHTGAQRHTTAPPPPASSDWPGSFPDQPERRCRGDGPPESPYASSPAAPPAGPAESAPPLWTSPAPTHADRGSQREGERETETRTREECREAQRFTCQVFYIKYLFNPALQTALPVLQTALPVLESSRQPSQCYKQCSQCFQSVPP